MSIAPMAPSTKDRSHRADYRLRLSVSDLGISGGFDATDIRDARLPNYQRLLDNPFRSEDDATRAESAIERLEFAIGHSKSDPEYSASLQRNMLVWEQWPKQKA